MSIDEIQAFEKTRNHFSIRLIEDYDARLLAGEKKRVIEKMEVRKSVQLLGFDNEINYQDGGQPYLVNHPELHLSISHSKGWIAVCIDQKPVGLDIEADSQKVIYGARYYTNIEEQQFINNMHDLHVVWSAKEVVYKLKSGNVSGLKSNVTIKKINKKTVDVVCHKEHFEFDYLQTNGVTIVVSK